MYRRTVASIAVALALAPVAAFAADKAPNGHMDCSCSHVTQSSTTRSASPNTYQGATQAELERIWAPSA